MAKLKDIISNKTKNDLLRVKSELNNSKRATIKIPEKKEIRDGGSASMAAYSLYSRFLMGNNSNEE